MMMVLNPTYTLQIVIKDAPPTVNQAAMQGLGGQMSATAFQRKWFNDATGKTGCDDVLAAVKEALSKAGLDACVRLERFEQK